MKSNYSELDKLEKILIELEKLYLQGNLTTKRIETAQKRLDTLAAHAQRDDSLGARRFVLYEFQALLYDAAGDVDDARRFANEAADIKGDGDLITQTVRELVSKDTALPVSGGKNYKRLEGWLAIFGVGIVFAPFVQIYNFIDSMSTANSVSSTYPSLSTLIFMEGFVSLVLAILFFVYWSYMAKKKKAARSFGIWLLGGIVVYSVIDMIVAGSISSGLVDDAAINSIIGKEFVGMLFTLGWMLYLVYSTRVKRTFVN